MNTNTTNEICPTTTQDDVERRMQAQAPLYPYLDTKFKTISITSLICLIERLSVPVISALLSNTG